MERMTFSVDRTAVTEGDIVEVRWACPGAESADLTIDNGYKATTLPLAIEGDKRFRLNRSKGRTRLTITAHIGGKAYSKTLRVKVKEMPLTHAETVDGRGRPMSRLRQWFQHKQGGNRLGQRWRDLRSRQRAAYRTLPPDKQMASRILLILGGVMLLSTFFPTLLYLGLMGVAGYLTWVLLRR